MLSVIELIVSGNTTSSVSGGTLDLYGNEDINVVFGIKDVRDIASTTSTYSQNFQIPGTKNNNRILSDLFLIGADGSFDPRKRAICTLIVDSIVIMDGWLQVVSIDVRDRDNPVYGVTVFSNVKGFNSAIKGKYLTDYDWSELNHVLNIPNIANTWSGTSSLGYYYSMKDYGYDYTLTGVKGSTTKEGIPIGNWYPDIYNKYILDKIMSAAGYSYSSALLSSATFAQTVTPFNGDTATIMGTDYISGRTFIATETPLSSITFNNMRNLPLTEAVQPYEYAYERIIRANVVISGSACPVNYVFSTTYGDKYVFDQPGISSFSVGVNYEYIELAGCLRGQIGARFYRSGYANGTVPFHEELSISEVAGTYFANFSTPNCDNTTNYGINGQRYKPFATGEEVWVSLYLRVNMGYTAPTMTAVPFKITEGGWYWRHFPSAQRTAGQIVNMNNVVPKNVLVTDYVKSIMNMFNIYIEPSKTVNNQFIMEDFESFYAGGTQRDWSTKLDRSQTVTETLVSEELAKLYTFTYKEDKDWLNEDYKNNIKRIYGDWTYDVDNEFITKEEKIEVAFSPTPCDNVVNSQSLVIPKIGKYDSNGKFGKANFNMRFLRKNPLPIKLNAGEFWRFTGTTTYDTYPYAGHLNHPFTGTTDYNWGSVPYVYYKWNIAQYGSITENNLVNTYWKKYLDEVTDKEARLITAYFKLSPKDIAEFSFRDTIYVDGISSEGGHFYRVNSITYSPNNNKTAKVELLKVLTKYTAKFPSRRIFLGNDVSIGIGGGNIGLNLGSAKVYHPGSIGIGEGTHVFSPYSFALGQGNSVNGGTASFVVGDNNIISPASTGTTIFGAENTVELNSVGSTIIGDYNYVMTGSSNAFIRGNRNYLVLGDRISIAGNNNYINSAVTGQFTSNLSIVGDGNVSYGQITGGTIQGDYNFISGSTTNISIFGHSNSASTTTSGVTINGNNNRVNIGASNIVINGFNNTISAGTTNVTVLGMSDLTTVLSNTVYTPSVSVTNNFILSTGSTLSMGGGIVDNGATLGVALGSGVTIEATASFGTGIGNLTEVTMVGEFAMASQGNYGQGGTVFLQNTTTNVTPKELYTDIPSTQRFVIPSGSSYYTRLYAVATDILNQKTVAYKGEGIIKNISGTTSMIGPVVMGAVGYDSYLSATSVSVSANTSNSSLTVTVSGQTSTTLNWICQVDYTKINQIL